MPGLSTVVSRIESDLNRGTAFTARIKVAIDDAIHFYRATRFGFNTKRSAFLVSAEYTSLTADWLETDILTLERSDYSEPLIEKSYIFIHEEKEDPDFTSEPVYFAIQNRQLRLYPVPDHTYSVQMSYLFDLGGVLTTGTGAEFSASDSFSNAWLDEALELIRAHAMIDLYENHIDGPESFAKADRLRLREQLELKVLKRRANREQGAGVVEPWL